MTEMNLPWCVMSKMVGDMKIGSFLENLLLINLRVVKTQKEQKIHVKRHVLTLYGPASTGM